MPLGVPALAAVVSGGAWGLPVQENRGLGLDRIRSMDTTCIKVHAHCANPVGGQHAQAMDRTKGGPNTKLTMIVDVLGRPLALRAEPSHHHDLKACAGLWRELRGG